ncbi:MAG: aldo/keto reductase [Pseudomonadota bacterium]
MNRSPHKHGSNALAYGCWRMTDGDVGKATRLIHAALDHGISHIDTADIYGYGEPIGFGGAEAVLGDVLKDDPGLRGQIVLATKGGVELPTPYNSHPSYLSAALDASLARLGVDHVDLYYVHRPDLTVAMADLGAALDAMVAAGKVLKIGVSNFSASQARALQANMKTALSASQNETSVWQQSPITDGVLDYAMEIGAQAYAWSPLAGGALATGRFDTGADTEAVNRVMSTIDTLAEHHSATRTQIALAFLRGLHASPVSIIGTQTPERIAEAADSLSVILSSRDIYDVIEARSGQGMP